MPLGAFALAYRCTWVRLPQPIDAHGCVCTGLSTPLGAIALAYPCHRVRLHWPMNAPGCHCPVDAPGCVCTGVSMPWGAFAPSYPCFLVHLQGCIHASGRSLSMHMGAFVLAYRRPWLRLPPSAFALTYECTWVHFHCPVDAPGCVCTGVSMPWGAFAQSYRCFSVHLQGSNHASGRTEMRSKRLDRTVLSDALLCECAILRHCIVTGQLYTHIHI